MATRVTTTLLLVWDVTLDLAWTQTWATQATTTTTLVEV